MLPNRKSLKRIILGIVVVLLAPFLMANGGAKKPTPTPSPESESVEFERDGRRYRKGIGGNEMVLVPSGTFMMGTSAEEIDVYLQEYDDWKVEWFHDSGPKHQVTLKSFRMNITEVTNVEFALFVEATGYKPEGGWMLDLRKINLPTVNVTWNDAQAYCRWIGGSLPTEAEWEYAAGGPERYRWSLGNSFDPATYSFDRDYLEAVGSYSINAYGLYDMSGSVWEWVSDWYDKDYYQESPEHYPEGPDTGIYRVIRGGAWDTNLFYLGIASRSIGVPINHLATLGFRCVSEAE